MDKSVVRASKLDKVLNNRLPLIYNLAIAQCSLNITLDLIRREESNRLCDYRRENQYE